MKKTVLIFGSILMLTSYADAFAIEEFQIDTATSISTSSREEPASVRVSCKSENTRCDSNGECCSNRCWDQWERGCAYGPCYCENINK